MTHVNWTPRAADDLKAICLFIARDAPQVAAVLAGRILAATERFAAYPRLGRVVPELQSEKPREIIVGSFRLIYRIRDGDVQVLTKPPRRAPARDNCVRTRGVKDQYDPDADVAGTVLEERRREGKQGAGASARICPISRWDLAALA